MLTVAAGPHEHNTLFARLGDFLRDRNPGEGEGAAIVHRLDRETSGLVVFAKGAEMRLLLQANWSEVEKTYLAIVEGRPAAESGTIASYLTETKSLQVIGNRRPTVGGKKAITHYRLLQSRGGFSLLEVRLETGRKHQIRVHLADLGCRVAGDTRYGATSNPCGRLALHASRLALPHPQTGVRLSLESPLPAALQKLPNCEAGQKWGTSSCG